MDGDGDRDTHWNTGLNSLGPNEKQKERECEQGKARSEGPFIRRWMAKQTETHTGAPDGVPQGPNEEQKEEEHEEGDGDREGCEHPLIQGD